MRNPLKNSRRSLVLTACGNAFEYYDFMLYSFFVSILSPLFFPKADAMSSLLLGFSVFALGFLARPLGALMFGWMGDRWGRKRALTGSLFLMAIPTLLMGLLPTYETWGLGASLGLAVLRILQGLAAGGEVNGAGVYAVEQAPVPQKAFYGALLISSAGVGALLATAMGAFFTASFMPAYGWRFPFILGGLVAFLAAYFRRHLEESTEFLGIPPEKRISLWQAMVSHPSSFLISFSKALAVGGFIHVPFYVLVGYMNPVLNAKGIITSFQMMLLNSVLIILGVMVLPFMGRLADRLSPACVMGASVLGVALLTAPLFFAFSLQSLPAIIAIEIIFLMVAEGFIGPSNAYLNSLFPVNYRYSGVAVASTLGTAILAGTTPLGCALLAKHWGEFLGPTVFTLLACLVGAYAPFQGMRKKQGRVDQGRAA